MGALLRVPPSQYDNLMRRLDELAQQIQALDKALRDHASLEAEDREAIAAYAKTHPNQCPCDDPLFVVFVADQLVEPCEHLARPCPNK